MNRRLLGFPGLPDVLWTTGRVVCAEFRDWDQPPPTSWVELAESIAGNLAMPQSHGNAFAGNFATGRLKGVKSSGLWRRIRNRASISLSTPAECYSMNVDSGYDYIVGENESDGYIAFDVYKGNGFDSSRFVVVVSEEIAETPEILIEKLSPVVREKLNAKYGAAYLFPKAASGNYYGMDASFDSKEIEKLCGYGSTEHHLWRVGRARSRSSEFYHYCLGYVREVFDINFLSGSHLIAPMKGGTVFDYANSIGSLKRSEILPELMEWRLNSDELVKARLDWEVSGLVLSAEQEPLQLR